MREQQECIDLYPGSDGLAEGLQVRIKTQTNMDDAAVDVYCRSPNQEKEADKAFCGQLKVSSGSQALVFLGDFNHTDICWRDKMAWHRQSRKFMQIIDENILMQVVEKPTIRVCYWTLY